MARAVGQAQQAEWDSKRVGLLVQGFEVPHLHVHVWPVNEIADFDLRNVTRGEDQGVLKANADRLRARLRDQGHGENVPTDVAPGMTFAARALIIGRDLDHA